MNKQLNKKTSEQKKHTIEPGQYITAPVLFCWQQEGLSNIIKYDRRRGSACRKIL